MNKKQLVAKLAGSLNQSKADAERTFDTITNTILDALKNDDSVKIAGFGTYKVAKRKARIGRNPSFTTSPEIWAIPIGPDKLEISAFPINKLPIWIKIYLHMNNVSLTA